MQSMDIYEYSCTEEESVIGEKAPRGSYERVRSEANRRWPDWISFEIWLADQVERFGVQFASCGVKEGVRYRQRFTLVCRRQHTGGESKYCRKTDKIVKESCKLGEGCPCSLKVTTFDGDRPEVFGDYQKEHSHEIGSANLRFCTISKRAKQGLITMAEDGVSRENALKRIVNGEFNQNPASAVGHLREQVIGMKQISYYFNLVLARTTRFHKDDAVSSSAWCDKLKKEESLLFVKFSSEPPPQGSGLDSDLFILVVQTPWQHEQWKVHGTNYLGMDATHNTTQYQGMLLFTIMARNDWGHGIPVAWMVASNGKQPTIVHFLSVFRARNPVVPRLVLSDRDEAQLSAIEVVYKDSQLLLCLWHVLHSWRKHLRTTQYPDVWADLQLLIRSETQEDFDKMYGNIKRKAPMDFVHYFETYWMPERYLKMWSFVYRGGRTLLQRQDTTNHVESWHHYIKTHLFGGHCNRRLDFLIKTLVVDALSHFKRKDTRQLLGFEGPSLLEKKRTDMEKRSLEINWEDVQMQGLRNDLEGGLLFRVRSQSNSQSWYHINWERQSCECLSFQNDGLAWCKHLCAVTRLLHECLGTDTAPVNAPAPNSSSDATDSTIPYNASWSLQGEVDEARSRVNGVGQAQYSFDEGTRNGGEGIWDEEDWKDDLPEASNDESTQDNASIRTPSTSASFRYAFPSLPPTPSTSASALPRLDLTAEGNVTHDVRLDATRQWPSIKAQLQFVSKMEESEWDQVPAEARNQLDNALRLLTGPIRNARSVKSLPDIRPMHPRLLSLTETARLMPEIKRKAPSQYAKDPYAAGQRSGNKVTKVHLPSFEETERKRLESLHKNQHLDALVIPQSSTSPAQTRAPQIRTRQLVPTTNPTAASRKRTSSLGNALAQSQMQFINYSAANYTTPTRSPSSHPPSLNQAQAKAPSSPRNRTSSLPSNFNVRSASAEQYAQPQQPPHPPTTTNFHYHMPAYAEQQASSSLHYAHPSDYPAPTGLVNHQIAMTAYDQPYASQPPYQDNEVLNERFYYDMQPTAPLDHPYSTHLQYPHQTSQMSQPMHPSIQYDNYYTSNDSPAHFFHPYSTN